MTIYEIYSCKVPFHEESDESVIRSQIIADEFFVDIPSNTPDFIQDMIQQCVKFDPTLRPDAEKLFTMCSTEYETATAQGERLESKMNEVIIMLENQ